MVAQYPARAVYGKEVQVPRCTPRIVNAAIGESGDVEYKWELEPSCEGKVEALAATPEPGFAMQVEDEGEEQTRRRLLNVLDVNVMRDSSTPTPIPAFMLAESADNSNAPLRPIKIVPLWPGGTFNNTYNSRQNFISVTTPASPNVIAAALVVTVTGHGMDGSGCGEFCPVTHKFSINGGTDRVLAFSSAGTQWGCANGDGNANGAPFGQVPNQYGTWFYGRHGWCPGQAVQPMAWDVSYDVAFPGQMNVLQYSASLYGSAYTGTGTAAEIVLTAYLVFYAAG